MAKPPHTGAAMRAFYPVCQVAELAAGYGYTTERINLSLRQHVAAIGRRVTTLGKGEEGLRQQLVLFQGYHNFCLPHASLRLPLAEPESTNGTGSAKRWCLQTPAMAAGLTDHVWSLREVL